MKLNHFIDLILNRSITSKSSFLFLEVSIKLLQLEMLYHHAPCVLSLNTLTNHFIIVLKHNWPLASKTELCRPFCALT